MKRIWSSIRPVVLVVFVALVISSAATGVISMQRQGTIDKIEEENYAVVARNVRLAEKVTILREAVFALTSGEKDVVRIQIFEERPEGGPVYALIVPHPGPRGRALVIIDPASPTTDGLHPSLDEPIEHVIIWERDF